jgi:hypothetical protein
MVNIAIDANLRAELGDVLATLLSPTQLGSLTDSIPHAGEQAERRSA